MSAVILDKPQPRKLAARELVVAPRMPPAPKEHTGNPFTTEGDMVADCDVEGCTYHVMGPRALVGNAIRLHHKMYHSDQIGVVLLNQPRQ